MSMIFPGMDPWLEAPLAWRSVHSRLVVYLADQLQSKLGDRYLADVEDRVYVEGPDRDIIPDVTLRQQRTVIAGHALAVADADAPDIEQVPELQVHETYVAILDLRENRTVVTVIEVLSPTNKYAGPGRDSYLDKQQQVRQSTTHLIEIDLLRAGPHVLAVPEWVARRRGPYAYLTCVNRAQGRRAHFELYRRRLQERLPRIQVPLAAGDADVALDVQAAVAQVYAAGQYLTHLNYGTPCVPPLSAEEHAWAVQLIQQARSPSS